MALEDGLFVAVEGIDGCGKTTVIDSLLPELRRAGIVPTITREPADNAVGQLLRQLSRIGELEPMTAALLSSAARHSEKGVLRATLRSGNLLIADRYYLSGLAYHAADGITFHTYASMNRDVPKPDLYLWLEVSEEVALARKPMRADRWEAPKFSSAVHRSYPLAVSYVEKNDKTRVIRVDANQAVKEVVRCVRDELLRLLDNWR